MFDVIVMQPPWKTPYRPSWTSVILGSAFFCFCAASLAWQATTNDRGLILNGVITFSPREASVFYWILSAFSVLFVILAILLVFARIRSSTFLELTSDALIIPRGFAGKRFRRISYSDIASISELSVAGSKSLRIRTATAQFWISSSVLPTSEDYQELKQFLS